MHNLRLYQEQILLNNSMLFIVYTLQLTTGHFRLNDFSEKPIVRTRRITLVFMQFLKSN